MDRQRNQRIAALFEEAVDLPPEEQVALLDRECRDDDERRAVERLLEAERSLQADDRAGTPLNFRLAASYSMLMESAAAPLAAAAGGGSTGGSAFLDTTAVEMPAGDAGVASTTGVTATPEVALPSPEPRRCAIDIGAVIGRYRVVERIGEGGMGIVFAARHEDLGHDAVVKVLLHHGMTSSDESAQRFMDEARIAAGIRHPGVVQVIDVGRHETGALFILMERLYGESLQRRLKRKGKLPPRAALWFALQTARALDAVHARGVVHRDLKPDNLFLVEDAEVPGGERVKILDFGIAKLHSRSSELTQSHVAMGTPPYMSPEQCMGAARVDSRADLYSLGVLLFEMLCGRLPFRCHGFGEYIMAHAQRTPPPVQRFARVSPALAQLVARLLAKRPEERFASARALVEALESLPELVEGWDPDRESMVSDPLWQVTTQEHLPGSSSQAKTTPAQPGSRPLAGRVWPPSTREPDTEPEASEPSGPMLAVLSNTRPEPVERPAATIPVIVEQLDSIPITTHTQPGQPAWGQGDTLNSAPGEAALATQRSGVGATLRWAYGLVPAGGLATLVVAVSAALLVNGAGSVSSIFSAVDQRPDGGMEDARVVKPDEALRQEMAALFENGSEAVQRELIDAIRDVGTSEAVEILYQGLEGTSDIRRAAGHALCALGWRDGAPRLRDAMRHSGGSLRVQLAAALLCLEDREAIVAVEEALDADAMVQLIAAEALAGAGQRARALPVLQRELARSEAGSAPWLRAAGGLLLLDDADARAALLRELARPEPARALAAAEILAGAGDREALAYLGRVLADAAFTHRAEAALALARHLDDSEAAGFADQLLAFGQVGLGSRHAHERRAAAAVMGRLAGHGEHLDAAGLEALRAKLEALRDDSDTTPDAEERAARLTARVALLAVYRALYARNHHE
jgi:serine/threonine protein kinase/HEAT repeat protein